MPSFLPTLEEAQARLQTFLEDPYTTPNASTCCQSMSLLMSLKPNTSGVSVAVLCISWGHSKGFAVSFAVSKQSL